MHFHFCLFTVIFLCTFFVEDALGWQQFLRDNHHFILLTVSLVSIVTMTVLCVCLIWLCFERARNKRLLEQKEKELKNIRDQQSTRTNQQPFNAPFKQTHPPQHPMPYTTPITRAVEEQHEGVWVPVSSSESTKEKEEVWVPVTPETTEKETAKVNRIEIKKRALPIAEIAKQDESWDEDERQLKSRTTSGEAPTEATPLSHLS